MSLDRFYKLRDMAAFPDKFETWDGASVFQFTGAPAWFIPSLMLPTYYFPNFAIAVPKGTTGNFVFTAAKLAYPSLTPMDFGVITIDVLPWTAAPWKANLCNTAVLTWLNPIGGWESYSFTGVQTPFQDDGKAQTFINAGGQKRYNNRSEVHQGVILSTGNLNAIHSRQISDLFKTIQAYVLVPGGSKPIIIDPTTFRQVKSSEPNRAYEFEFRYCNEDIIQTQ